MRYLSHFSMYYLFIFLLLLCAELIYFRIADRFNIIDKPSARGSHTRITLRGGRNCFLFRCIIVFFYPPFRISLVCTSVNPDRRYQFYRRYTIGIPKSPIDISFYSHAATVLPMGYRFTPLVVYSCCAYCMYGNYQRL